MRGGRRESGGKERESRKREKDGGGGEEKEVERRKDRVGRGWEGEREGWRRRGWGGWIERRKEEGERERLRERKRPRKRKRELGEKENASVWSQLNQPLCGAQGAHNVFSIVLM